MNDSMYCIYIKNIIKHVCPLFMEYEVYESNKELSLYLLKKLYLTDDQGNSRNLILQEIQSSQKGMVSLLRKLNISTIHYKDQRNHQIMFKKHHIHSRIAVLNLLKLKERRRRKKLNYSTIVGKWLQRNPTKIWKRNMKQRKRLNQSSWLFTCLMVSLVYLLFPFY